MTKVYRVRCNLFHGDKHVTNEKDIKLVTTSNVVLERFLRGCAAERLGYEHVFLKPDSAPLSIPGEI